MDKQDYTNLTNKLDIIIKLLALNVKGDGSQKEQVSKLLSAGFSASQIANVLGKPVNLITAYVSNIKKAK